MQTNKIAGKIMTALEAFHGSRPAIDAHNILIVRGMSRKRFDSEKMDVFLSDLFKDIGARQVDMFSKEGGTLLGIMDERIRENIPIQTETDVSGIQKLKQSLEAMNCQVEYALGIQNNMGIFIVTWIEVGGIGPRFVEVVVANLE